MLNRLKAAWKVLRSEKYIVLCLNRPAGSIRYDADPDYNCSLGLVHQTASELYTASYSALQMVNLVEQAQAVLDKKVN